MTWILLGEGRHRAVYLLPSEKNVVKVPINTDGVYDNQYEARKFKEFIRDGSRGVVPGRWRPARCRLVPNSSLLVMEFVQAILKLPYEEANDILDANKWTNFIDCHQVGHNEKGELVAYDYA